MKRKLTVSRSGKNGSSTRIQYSCAMCTRTLDDCLFVDENTKLFTPYCKVCRKLLRDSGNEFQNPNLLNIEKTTSVISSSIKQAEKSLSSMKKPASSLSFAVWDKINQKLIFNKELLYGVVPCVKWSVSDESKKPDMVYQAKLIFHRLHYVKCQSS